MNRGFVPSRDGFAFANRWPRQPALTLPTLFGRVGVGNAAGGLCGGMVFAALDYWHAQQSAPDVQPGAGHPLYKFFVRRLIDSWRLPIGVSKYYQWMVLPDADTTFPLLGVVRGLYRRTVEVQWPSIAEDLDRSVPVPLGIVTSSSKNPRALALNHQVLAVGYTREGNSIKLQVYDPNRGRRDDTHITFSTADPTTFEHNLGLSRPIRGFFRVPYKPRKLPAL